MARLIVEENGRRRVFRVRSGKLTLGSGESCTLRLAAPGVAEVHAELELSGGTARLAPRPGVVPPTVDGRPLQQPARLRDGARVAIGGATLVLHYDEGEGGASAPPPAREGQSGAAAQAPARPGGAAGSGSAAAPPGPAGAAPRPARVQPGRPLHEIRRGTPAWLVLLGFAAALLVALAFAKNLWKQGASSFDPALRYREALKQHNIGDHDLAREELDKIDPATLSPALALQVQELRAAIAAAEGQRGVRVHNEQGDEYLETQLKRFEEERLQGDPPREAVRVFLKRCQAFRERWPQHPELDWVARHENRFRGYVNLGEPATFRDIEYEVKTMTWAMPRDYKQAFATLEQFLAQASAEDRTQGLALQAKLEQERAEYFADRMQQAAWHWRRDEKGQAVEWLAQLVMRIGDPGMQAEAARELVGLPGVEDWLRGYKSGKPDKFEILVQEPQIRALALEKQIL